MRCRRAVGEPLLRALQIFELASPLDVVAGREFHAFLHALGGGIDVAVDVVRGNIDKDETDELAILVADGWRARAEANIRQSRNRHLRASGRGHEDALQRMNTMDARKARVVELKFFGGLTMDEIAEVVGISRATVEREWRFARAWLFNALGGPA